MKHLNNKIFLFRDKSYEYLLAGNKLILCPLGHGKVKEYTLSADEVRNIVDYYLTPIQELKNNHPTDLVEVVDDIFDYQYDLGLYVYEILDYKRI